MGHIQVPVVCLAGDNAGEGLNGLLLRDTGGEGEEKERGDGEFKLFPETRRDSTPRLSGFGKIVTFGDDLRKPALKTESVLAGQGD